MVVDRIPTETISYSIKGKPFEVDRRYTNLEPMSQTSYGTVCSAHDSSDPDEQVVAVKKIEHIFDQMTICKRTLREIRILRHLSHENIMHLRETYVLGSIDDFREIYVVSELMETDLASTIQSNQAFSDEQVQFLLYQALRGMKYVHSANVVHRDLNPRNLLVNSNCDLKICNFGLSRVLFEDKEWGAPPVTDYVCTRYYRAPEVLCTWTDYSFPVDVWSLGCVFGEMYVRKPLFPGHNTHHQLDLIVHVLGAPEEESLQKICNLKVRKFIKSLPKQPDRNLSKVVEAEGAGPEAQDLLVGMLRWDPVQRPTVAAALTHAYLEKLHCAEDEPSRAPLDSADFEFERRRITAATLRGEIFREALFGHPELLAQFDKERRKKGCKHSVMDCRLMNPGEQQGSSEDEG